MVKSVLFFSIVCMTNILYGEFREITPLENISIIEIENINQDKGMKRIEKKSRDNSIKYEDSRLNEGCELKEENKIEYIENGDEVKEVIEKNSVPLISEEQLIQIINMAKNSPLPENNVENKENSIISKESDMIQQPDFLIDIKNKLDKYSFSDKSEDIYGGQITAKEITSDKIIDNLEFGLGVAYKNSEYDNSQYENKNSDIWSHTPIYATGKYRLSSDEDSSKYLKLNLGYAIGEYEENEEYLERKNQSGMYYGIGAGVEYTDLSLDLIYQVNKDAYEKWDNSTKDDSRITFSIDYKLSF